MLKMGEPTKQQMREPTELLTQRPSLVRKILMFPLTRLLIAGIVFALVAISVAGVAILVAGIAVLIIGQLHPVDLSVSSVSSLPNNALEAMGVILMYGLFAVAGIITLALISKVIEQRSLAEVGLGRRGLLRNTVLGLGIGAGEVLLCVLGLTLAALFGVIDPTGFDPATFLSDFSSSDWQPLDVFGNLVLTFFLTCFVAVFEELIFRGFLFRILEEGLGSWLALAISSLLFGIVHLDNFTDPTLLDVTPQIVGGLMLAAAYILTRKLWFSIGIHWGWDFMIFALSGGNIVSAMTETSDSGGALETVLLSLPDVILGIVLLALVVQRGQVFIPRWMQRKPANA